MKAADSGHALTEEGLITRLWQRVPSVLRAFVTGSVVLTAGGVFTDPLITGDATLWPDVPWSAALLLVWMAIFWRYARGQWWPKSTASTRRAHLRAHPLTAVVWRFALVTGAFGPSCPES